MVAARSTGEEGIGAGCSRGRKQSGKRVLAISGPADEGSIRCYVLDSDGTNVKELPIPSEDEGEALCLWGKPTSNAELILSHISTSKVQQFLLTYSQ